MTTQTEMFPPLQQPDQNRFTTIQGRFEEFHRLNPWVYRTLCTLARTMTSRGHKSVGIKMLYEVMRWHYYQKTTDAGGDFKLDNRHTSRYARLMMENEPDLKGVFETRKLTAA